MMNPFTLEGKVALVTGGSRGIGEAVARGLAAQGASVIVAARKQPGIAAVVSSLTAAGLKADAYACHTGKAADVDALFHHIKTQYGRLDILVNNAATNPYFGPFILAEESAFDKTFEVNVKGYFLPAREAARMMVDQGGGSIINVASIEGLSPSPMMGVYSMTKAAVIMMTKVIARELGGSKVRCNCVCPGLTETRFAQVLIQTPEIYRHYIEKSPMGRHAQPEEIVGAVLYLASDAARHTTGAVITCDGGTSV